MCGSDKKSQMASCNPLTEGYAAHLTKISSPGGSVPAQGNARMVIPRFAATFSDTKNIGTIFFQNLFWVARPVSTSACTTPPPHSTLSADQLKKVIIIDVMMRMMLMTILVMAMTVHLALEIFLFNLQIQLSAAISSAIFSHVHVMKFVKEETCFTKSHEI